MADIESRSSDTVIQLLEQGRQLFHRLLLPVFRKEGLSPSDVMVLKMLSGECPPGAPRGETASGVRLTDLGREIGLPLSTLTAVIDRLERLRYVERVPSPTDRRSIRVRPAEGWRAVERRLRRRVNIELSAVLTGLPEERLVRLSDDLAALVAVLRERLAAREEER